MSKRDKVCIDSIQVVITNVNKNVLGSNLVFGKITYYKSCQEGVQKD